MAILLAVSVVVSLGILGWSIIDSVKRATDPASQATSIDGVNSASVKGDSPHVDKEAYVAEMRERDRKLMERLRERNERKTDAPSRDQVIAQWRSQVDDIRTQLKHVKRPKEGTIEWHQQKRLESLLLDAPQKRPRW